MLRELFSTPLWEYKTKISGAGVIKHINTLKTTPSDDFDLWEYRKDECLLSKLHDYIQMQAAWSIQQLYPNATVELDRAWLNTQYKNQGLLPHDHGVNLVGCLYLQTQNTTGDLILIDPRGATNWKVETEKGYSGMKGIRITPEEGLLLFFPGYVTHYVTENTSDTPRVSLAVNIRVNFD